MSKIASLLLMSMLLSLSEALIYSRCGLGVTLLRNGVPRNLLNHWICMAEAESGLNSAAVGPVKPDRSRNVGIFQINSYWYCSGVSPTYNMCGLPCAALADNDISNDIQCAKKIYSQKGFGAWPGWQARCKGRDVSNYTTGCNL